MTATASPKVGGMAAVGAPVVIAPHPKNTMQNVPKNSAADFESKARTRLF
jgi:hypothetical protein